MYVAPAPALTPKNPVSVQVGVPGVWGFAAYITATNYLQAQKIVRPQAVTSALVLAVHAPMNYLFIYIFGMHLLS